jgi:hypothetical protein
MKKLIHVALSVLIIVLGFLLVKSIMNPIKFKDEQTYRYDIVVQKLKDIRTAQNAYKDSYGQFTGSLDTLTNFVKFDSLKLVFKKGEIPEELLGQISEREAIQKGMIIRDTLRVAVLDSLFGKSYPIDSLRFIPFSNGVEFRMTQGEVVTGSKLKVKVFEAKAPSKYILLGLNKQMIINYNDGWDYPGLMVGSIEEANNSAGNWE